MMFQTYIRVDDGRYEKPHWQKFDPCPVPAKEAQATIRAIRNNEWTMRCKWTHICAMPVSWSFA